MGLYLDTSDVAVVKALSCTSPLMGVTTNPSIIAMGEKPLEVVLPQLREAVGGQEHLFAQIMATTVEETVNDTRRLRSTIANTVVKVPVTAEGLAAIKILKVEGIPTLGTTVYGAAQGLLSALVGTEHVTSYVNRIDAQGDSGIQAVADLHQLLKMHTPQTEVLAASFRIPRQALNYLLAGGEPATLPLDVAQQMISYPAADAVVAKSKQDW